MLIVGIDPGLTGGIAIISAPGPKPYAGAIAMPVQSNRTGKGNEVDVPALLQYLIQTRNELIRLDPNYGLGGLHVYIELVGNMPRKRGGKKVVQGATSMFNFGAGFGRLIGAIDAYKYLLTESVVVHFPRPQTWQKMIFSGMKTGNTKKKALSFVQGRFPDLSLLRTSRCTTPHQGMSDALCIAEYGRLQLLK